MLRVWLNLLLAGMALGMLLNLRQGELHHRAPLFSPALVPGMDDEQGRMDIAAFTQQGNRTLERFGGGLEDQDGFPGNEPAGMVAHDPLLNAVPGASQPEEGRQAAGQRTGNDQQQGTGAGPA